MIRFELSFVPVAISGLGDRGIATKQAPDWKADSHALRFPGLQ
jgi:hypothetical protein